MKTFIVQYRAHLPGCLPPGPCAQVSFSLHMAISAFDASCPVETPLNEPICWSFSRRSSHTVLNTRPCCFSSQPGPPRHHDNGPKHHVLPLQQGESVVLVLRTSKQNRIQLFHKIHRNIKAVDVSEGQSLEECVCFCLLWN